MKRRPRKRKRRRAKREREEEEHSERGRENERNREHAHESENLWGGRESWEENKSTCDRDIWTKTILHPSLFLFLLPPYPAPSWIHFKYCLLILLAQLKGVPRIHQLLENIFASKEYYNIYFFLQKSFAKETCIWAKSPTKETYVLQHQDIFVCFMYIYTSFSPVVSFSLPLSLSLH